jgi:hypothetical protein
MKKNNSLGNNVYSPPVVTVITLFADESVLVTLSGGVGLPGAGINEGNADDLGGVIW